MCRKTENDISEDISQKQSTYRWIAFRTGWRMVPIKINNANAFISVRISVVNEFNKYFHSVDYTFLWSTFHHFYIPIGIIRNSPCRYVQFLYIR